MCGAPLRRSDGTRAEFVANFAGGPGKSVMASLLFVAVYLRQLGFES
jgi:hypothetical protein